MGANGSLSLACHWRFQPTANNEFRLVQLSLAQWLPMIIEASAEHWRIGGGKSSASRNREPPSHTRSHPMLTAADGAAMAATADPQIFTAGSFTFKLTGDLVFLASNERGGWTWCRTSWW